MLRAVVPLPAAAVDELLGVEVVVLAGVRVRVLLRVLRLVAVLVPVLVVVVVLVPVDVAALGGVRVAVLVPADVLLSAPIILSQTHLLQLKAAHCLH